MYLGSQPAVLEDKAAAGCLPEFETKQLAHFHKKQNSLEDKKTRNNQAVYLVGKASLTERSKQRATALSRAEER